MMREMGSRYSHIPGREGHCRRPPRSLFPHIYFDLHLRSHLPLVLFRSQRQRCSAPQFGAPVVFSHRSSGHVGTSETSGQPNQSSGSSFEGTRGGPVKRCEDRKPHTSLSKARGTASRLKSSEELLYQALDSGPFGTKQTSRSHTDFSLFRATIQ